MPNYSLLVRTVLLAAAVLVPAAARADIPPSCDSTGNLVTCAAADVGKSCPSGGTCFEMQCVSGGDGVAKLYKCDTCPTIIAAPSGTCTISNMGTACSDGDGGTGTCGAIRAYCNTSSDKFVCQAPAPTTPDGGGTGTAGSGGSGGCDVAPKPTPSLIGFGLVVAGLAFVIVERVRRRRNR